MGLTQCFYAVEPEDVISDTDFRDNHGDKYSFCYFASFSKEASLHDWMKRLWKKKVPDTAHRNLCDEYIALRKEDIDALARDFHDRRLPLKDRDEWSKKLFRDFLEKASDYIQKGCIIYYEARY